MHLECGTPLDSSERRWHHLIAEYESTVYACGPIAGKTFDQATWGWRLDLQDELEPHGIKVISPMRGKEELGLAVKPDEPLGAYYDPRIIMSTPHSIVKRDFFDVSRCSLVFAYLLDTERVSIGSMFELAWCHLYHKPAVIVMDEGGLHDHPFVRQAGFVVPDFDTGVEITRQILRTGL